ncbi:MAG: hypothetical protein VB012_00895 [Erysipelotrichaceae bacterium]|nr:hypothetical protein [Erysipelotrichaceae bacterium]
MKRKLKLFIRSADKQVNLPSVSIDTALFLLRLGLWQSMRFIKENPDIRQIMLDNRELLDQSLTQIMLVLKTCEPIILVEVQSHEDYVLIELR